MRIPRKLGNINQALTLNVERFARCRLYTVLLVRSELTYFFSSSPRRTVSPSNCLTWEIRTLLNFYNSKISKFQLNEKFLALFSYRLRSNQFLTNLYRKTPNMLPMSSILFLVKIPEDFRVSRLTLILTVGRKYL